MPRAKSARTILFIDKDGDLVDGLSPALQGAGYRVQHAADGDEGVRMAAKKPPDLIILDFMMPTLDGFDVCSQLGNMEDLREVPILVLTAYGRRIAEMHDSGRTDARPNIKDYLEKPLEPNVLLDRVRTLLNNPGTA